MDTMTRRTVRTRANGFCEYCHIHEDESVLSHHIEHIIAKQHGGSAELDNLALACHHCVPQ
jgi:5-methylcytosine-specific restriction endonuclease McrA